MSLPPPQPSTARRRRMLIALLGAVCGAWIAAGLTLARPAAALPAEVQAALASEASRDMGLPSEALPNGAPSWGARPRLNLGNAPNGFTAFVPWGQLYTCAGGNPQPDARVQLGPLVAFIRSRKTGAWIRIDTSGPVEGAYYREDYVGDVHTDADAVVLPGDNVSVKVPVGANYHFVPMAHRQPFDPADLNGVFVAQGARMLPGSWDATGKLPPPCYTLSVGADYWRTLTAPWDGVQNNDDVGIGRFKRVTGDWRIFTLSTVSEGTLANVHLPYGE